MHRVQRRRVRHALAERLRFETLLSDLSAMFAAGPVTEVDQQIGTGLRRIVEDLGADRATVGTVSTSSDIVLATHSWTREGVTPLREAIRGVAVPWIVSQVRQGQVVALRRLADLPPEATADRECLTARHAVHHRGASRRGRRGHRHARGGHAPGGAALAR